jgi:hypothetical protein
MSGWRSRIVDVFCLLISSVFFISCFESTTPKPVEKPLVQETSSLFTCVADSSCRCRKSEAGKYLEEMVESKCCLDRGIPIGCKGAGVCIDCPYDADIVSRFSFKLLATASAYYGGFRNPHMILGSDGLPLILYENLTKAYPIWLQGYKCHDAVCGSGNAFTFNFELIKGGSFDAMVGNDGLPLVFYNQDSGLVIRRCANQDCTESGKLLIGRGMAAMSPTVCLRKGGLPVVGFLDSLAELKVIHCGNEDCSSGNSISTMAKKAYTHYSFLLDADQVPLAAFVDLAGRLAVARCGDSNCTAPASIVAITPANDSVCGTTSCQSVISAAIAGDGNPLIAFAYKDSIALIKCANRTCSQHGSVKYLDRGRRPGLLVGADGKPILLYQNDGMAMMKCADDTCGAQSVRTQITGLDQDADFILDATGAPIISLAFNHLFFVK